MPENLGIQVWNWSKTVFERILTILNELCFHFIVAFIDEYVYKIFFGKVEKHLLFKSNVILFSEVSNLVIFLAILNVIVFFWNIF